jgi:iron complex outermembrane receptor protein
MHTKTRIAAAAALAAGGLAAAVPALAQETQRIEITGSATKRIDAETTLPVTILSREDIARTGVTTAAELLDRLSANNGQGYNVSLAVGDSARPGFAGASLRGLGPNTTLVLLNGRRLAVYAFDGGGVDLNAIPLGAIERVEILRDGASALYGTDAIAGVINFITRKDYRGIELGATARVPHNSGGQSAQAVVAFGAGDLASDRFNVFANITFDDQKALKASQRDFSKTSFLPNAPGGPFDKTSGNTIPASILTPVGLLNPGVPDCRPPASFQTTPTGACRFDYASVIDNISPQERIGGLLRGTFQLAPQHELIGEWSHTRTKSTFRSSPTPASSATTFNGDPVLYPEGGRWYPRALNPATGQLEPGVLNHLDGSNAFVPLAGDLPIFWRVLDMGPRTNETTAKQERLLLGARGSFGGWDYDVAALKSTSKVTDRYVGGWLFESKLLNATCTVATDCGPASDGYTVGTLNPDINPFGPNDAAGLAALRSALVLGPTRIAKSSRTSVDGKVTGEVGKLPGGPIAVAFGAERRTERYDDKPLAVLNSGDVIGGGGNQLPVDGKRNVTAVFGEAVFPVFKGLEALVQARHDKYSDFGSTTNPKIGIRWQPTREWLVRASAGTGFRAPTLPDLLTPESQTNTGGNYNDPYYEAKVGDCYDANGTETANFNPQFCNAQLTVKQGGNRNLQPEKSRQASLGIVFQPSADISVAVDVWRIKVRDQIATPSADATLGSFIQQFLADPNANYDPTTAKLSAAGRAALQADATGTDVVIDPQSGFLGQINSFFDNIATTTTTGVDLSIKAVVARNEYGVFSAALDSTYLDSQKQNGVELVGQFATFGPVVRWKHVAGLDWQTGPWSTALTYNYSAGYRDSGGTRDVGAWETFDLALAWRGVKNLTLRAAVSNLLDRKPPFTRQAIYFQLGYDPMVADPRGRTFGVGLNYKFD